MNEKARMNQFDIKFSVMAVVKEQPFF